MIMPRGSDQLLLPVNPLFIALSLVLAFGFSLLPVGRHAAAPDLLAVVLVFWNVHQPRRVSVGLAFLFGLLMDVHEAALLGQHALSYTLLSFAAITVHRRLLEVRSGRADAAGVAAVRAGHPGVAGRSHGRGRHVPGLDADLLAPAERVVVAAGHLVPAGTATPPARPGQASPAVSAACRTPLPRPHG